MVDLRSLTINDIGQALELSAGENWNQTEMEWDLLISNPGNICLALEAEGRIVGTATAMNYRNEVAWIGMVLVQPEFRGKGWSKKLLLTLFENLDASLSIKLDATPAGKPVYEKVGFKQEYRINRLVADSVTIEPSQLDRGFSICPVLLDDISAIVEYDKKVFGTGREKLLESIVKGNPGTGWFIKQNGQIAGFVLGRQGRRFYHVGPIEAESEQMAEILVAKALGELKGRPVVLDILDDKDRLARRLKAAGFAEQRHFLRMYRYNNSVRGLPQNHFLICSPEFG